MWDPSELSWPLSSGGEVFLLDPPSWLLSTGCEGFLLDPSDSPPPSPPCPGGDGFSLDASDFGGPLPSLPLDSDGWIFSNERVWDFGNSSGRRVRGFGNEIE